jgi:hypothetical protein
MSWTSQLLLWLLGAGGVVLMALRRSRADWFALGFLAACAAGVVMGLRFYPHYFMQLLPAGAACFAVGARDLWQRLETWRRVRRAAARAAIVAACAVMPFAGSYKYFFEYSPNQAVNAIYGYLQPFDQTSLVADYLQKRTAPDEKVFILGSEPEVYFQAQRVCPSRFAYIFPLTHAGANTLAWQREAIAEIQKQPPSYIIIVIFDNSVGVTPQTPDDFFNALETLIRRSYYLDAFTFDVNGTFVLIHRSEMDKGTFVVRPEGQTERVVGPGSLLVAESMVPRESEVLLFHRRAPGETFPDVRTNWSFVLKR